ncbi:tRNA dihydrouridine synthase DusB [bacterium]|nr:tRNA dihydrouridine synthase DusB [bacterium]
MQNIKIGNLQINSQVSLAPMAGITDYVLRSLVRKYSKTCLLTTEMISSEALAQHRDGVILNRDNDHSPISYQLSGHKPELMAMSAKKLENFADIIDINMGCPVNKVVKGQDGSALMRNPMLACELVKAIKSVVNIPVSVKFRLGYTSSEMNFVEYGVQMQEAGADFITIHGRTRAQMYAGNANWDLIKDLKKNVDIPVFANGDVVSIETAVDCLEKSGADGVAVGRGILGDPTLISRIERFLTDGVIIEPPTLEEKIELMKKHLDSEIALRGELDGIRFVRKFYPFYINKVENAAKYRYNLVREENYKMIIKYLDDILSNENSLV